MNNFIVRTITGIIFVVAIVVSFLNPLAMIFLFSLVTGMTVWEFAGLVNERENVHINQFITSVAGVLLFLAMAVHARGLDTLNLAFVPWLATIIYLLVSELYLKATDPIANWAYTMMTQLYIALPFSLLNVLAFQFTNCDLPWLLPLSVFMYLWVNDSGAYCCDSLLRASRGRAASEAACSCCWQHGSSRSSPRRKASRPTSPPCNGWAWASS